MKIAPFDGKTLRGNGACARLAKPLPGGARRPLKFDEAGIEKQFDPFDYGEDLGAPDQLVEAAFTFSDVEYFFCLAPGEWHDAAAQFECFLSVVRRAKAMFDLDPELRVAITFGLMGIGNNSIFGPAVEKTCWIEESYVKAPGIVLSRSLSSFVLRSRRTLDSELFAEFDQLFPRAIVNHLGSMRLN